MRAGYAPSVAFTPHKHLFLHPKYSSKYLEDELITTKLPNGFSSTSASLLQIKACSRQTTEQSQWNKKQNPRAQKLFQPKGCGYLLMLCCYNPCLQREKHTRLQHSYLLLQQNYWWWFYRGTQTGPCSPRCKGEAQKSAVAHGEREVAKHSLKYSWISLSQPSGCL